MNLALQVNDITNKEIFSITEEGNITLEGTLIGHSKKLADIIMAAWPIPKDKSISITIGEYKL